MSGIKCLACDFGGSSVKYALVDADANMEQSGKIPAPLKSKEEFVETIYTLYKKYENEIDGIALSIPGYINSQTGELYGSGVYRELYGCNIIDLVQEKCPVNVAVENDGKCGALSEAWRGSLADCRDGVVLILGSAVGGGVIKNRTVHWGKNFTAGEFSYMITDPGKYKDMMLAYMSVGVLGMTYKLCKYKNLDIDSQDSSEMLHNIDMKLCGCFPSKTEQVKHIKADGEMIFNWVEQEDPDAVSVYKDFIDNLAVLIHNIQVCYSPERIVIGGGISRQERVFKDLRTKLNQLYQDAECGQMLHAEIVRSRYMEECNLLGAAYHYIEEYGVFGELPLKKKIC